MLLTGLMIRDLGGFFFPAEFSGLPCLAFIFAEILHDKRFYIGNA